MNINSPFELLELNKKDIISILKQRNVNYKVDNRFITFNATINELNLNCEVSIYCGYKKVYSISFGYVFDEDLEEKTIFKKIDEIKNTYKNQFEIENYFDPVDGKSFWYSFGYKGFDIYIHGTSYCSTESDKHFVITYDKTNKHILKTQSKTKEKRMEIKEKYIKRLNKYVNNDNFDKWYGLLHSVKNSRGISSPCRVDAAKDKLIIYYVEKFKVVHFEIEYNKIRRYDIHDDFVHIRYNDNTFLLTIVKSDVSMFDRLICDKIGYNSDKYKDFNKIIEDAFFEYDVFNNTSCKEERYNRYIKETTKSLFRRKELNNESIYNVLQCIDFDMYFYLEWKNFADYLYIKLIEHNYI